MKNKIPMLIGGFLAVLVVVGSVAAGVAYADDSTPPTTSSLPAQGRGHGGPRLSDAELEAAAKVLGMTTDEISTALEDGKTLEDLATDAGVDFADLQEALQTVRRAEMRAQIEQAVTDGTMTQDKADWLLEGLDKGYLDGRGLGFGPGGRGGHGQPPAEAPAATPTTSE
jgi:uncharacterized membrane protein